MRENVKKPRQKYIRCIERRVTHLEKRIQTSKQDLTFDKAEVNALRWAVVTLKSLYPNEYKRDEEQVSAVSQPAEEMEK